jgi:hypothetical protein
MTENTDFVARMEARVRANPIGAIAIGLVAVTTAAGSLLAFWDQLSPRISPQTADLVVSQQVAPLESFAAIEGAGGRVYPEGADVYVNLQHDQGGPQSILVQNIMVAIARYDSTSPCQYPSDANKIPGAGTLTPNVYVVALRGNEVAKIIWTDRKDGSAKPIAGADLLNSTPPNTFTLGDSEGKVEPLRIRVLAKEAGTYEVSFALRYVVSDQKELVEQTTDHFLICKT